MPPGTPERCHLFFLQRMLLENVLNSLENAMEHLNTFKHFFQFQKNKLFLEKNIFILKNS